MTPRLNVYVGIFDNELGQRFLRALTLFVRLSVGEMWERCSKEDDYWECLQRVKMWKSSLLQNEVQRVTSSYSDVDTLYRAALRAYYTSYHATRENVTEISVPPFTTFASKVLERIVTDEQIVDGNVFLPERIVHLKLLVMDVVRDVLHDILNDSRYVRHVRTVTIEDRRPADDDAPRPPPSAETNGDAPETDETTTFDTEAPSHDVDQDTDDEDSESESDENVAVDSALTIRL